MNRDSAEGPTPLPSRDPLPQVIHIVTPVIPSHPQITQRAQRLFTQAAPTITSRGAVNVLAHLSGGYTNDNFLIEVGAVRYVLRLGSALAHALGVDRQREQRVLMAAAGAGLLPDIVAFDVASGDMLSRFVEAPSAADYLVATPAVAVDVVTLARLLRRAHALPVVTAAADPRDWIARSVATAMRTGFVWPGAMAAALAHLNDIVYQPSALTHHDVNPWNILHTAQGDLLLDWEYAGFGDPAFDLAGVTTLWSLTTQAQRDLLDAYGANDALRQRMDHAVWLFRLRELTWAGFMLAADHKRSEIVDQYNTEAAWLGQWVSNSSGAR